MSKKKRPHGHYCKICGEYKANESFGERPCSPHLQSLLPFKRCGKSGGNGYEPPDGLPHAAAYGQREEMAESQNARSMPGGG